MFDELPKATQQMSLFEIDPKSKAIHQMLSQIDINTISPVEALLKLNEILNAFKK
jgi:DNA mismatch repair protein MutS